MHKPKKPTIASTKTRSIGSLRHFAKGQCLMTTGANSLMATPVRNIRAENSEFRQVAIA